ncbi:MAG: hypothetical protein QOE41_48 [Mycobacterium sp.]|jgi:hypothetical protein|nr:hypothetical protein [Mycobacterium sp.]MDT5130737.1 hypothetical protein [Mycobacterium sp.]
MPMAAAASLSREVAAPWVLGDKHAQLNRPGESGGELSVWKIALGLCLTVFDVVVLIWLIGQHVSQWLTTASSGWWM